MSVLTAAPSWPGSAVQTTRRVLEWARQPDGIPPDGSLAGVAGVPADTTAAAALRELTRSVAARIGAGQPALGDPGPIGPGALFLAAAIGGRLRHDVATRLAALVAPPPLDRSSQAGWADALARHAVAGPALAAGISTGASTEVRTGPRRPGSAGSAAGGRLGALAEALADDLLRASPLSAVLVRPADGQATYAADVALGMLARPRGPDVLATVLSDCADDARVLAWRTRLLARLAPAHPGVVIEVYAAARLGHGARWDQRLAASATRLAAATRGQPDALSVASVQFWAPLLVRQVREQLTQGRLLRGYEQALALVRRYGLDTVGGL
jgi:hypothetical protein